LPKGFISAMGRIGYNYSMTLIDQTCAQVTDMAAYTSITGLNHLKNFHYIQAPVSGVNKCIVHVSASSEPVPLRLPALRIISGWLSS
jgi:hypothetical protein